MILTTPQQRETGAEDLKISGDILHEVVMLLTEVVSYAPAKELEKDMKCYWNILGSFRW